MLAASAGAFPWNWDAVTAISTAVLGLGLGISALAFVQQRRSDREQRKQALELQAETARRDREQREQALELQAETARRDREQREQAVELQADAARRDLATKIMIDAYCVIIDGPWSRDDTFLEKIQNPLSMLQLVMNDEEIGIIRDVIKAQTRAINTNESVSLSPLLNALRARIRENLGVDKTDQPFEYLRTWIPRTRSMEALVALWLVLVAELAGDGSQERTMQQLKGTARLVELMGWRREREIVGALTEEWASANCARREQLADELGGWIRETQQIIDGNGHGVWWGHLGDQEPARADDEGGVTHRP